MAGLTLLRAQRDKPVVRAQSSDDREAAIAAFEVQASACRNAAFAYAYAALGCSVAAEDAVQEAFVRAFSSRHTLRDSRLFVPWLLRIVRNACHDSRRRQKVRASVPLDDSLISPLPLPETALLDRTRQTSVHAAVQALPERLRIPVELFYGAGLTYQEIAETLGVPHSTIVGRLAQAMRTLRRQLCTEEEC